MLLAIYLEGNTSETARGSHIIKLSWQDSILPMDLAGG